MIKYNRKVKLHFDWIKLFYTFAKILRSQLEWTTLAENLLFSSDSFRLLNFFSSINYLIYLNK